MVEQNGNPPRHGANLQESEAWTAAIRRRRRELRLTQRQLADLAGLAERTVIAVERGSRGVRLGSLIDVLTVLGLGIRIGRGQGIKAIDV